MLDNEQIIILKCNLVLYKTNEGWSWSFFGQPMGDHYVYALGGMIWFNFHFGFGHGRLWLAQYFPTEKDPPVFLKRKKCKLRQTRSFFSSFLEWDCDNVITSNKLTAVSAVFLQSSSWLNLKHTFPSTKHSCNKVCTLSAHKLNNSFFVFFSMISLGQCRATATHITNFSFVKESVCVYVVYSYSCILKRTLRTSDYVPHFPQPWTGPRVRTWQPKTWHFSLLQLLLEQNTSSVSFLFVSSSNVSLAFTNFTFVTLKIANLIKIDAFVRGMVNMFCKNQ